MTDPSVEISKGKSDTIPIEQLKLEVGMLGNLFGCGEHSARNIGGLVALLLIIFGAAVVFIPCSRMEASEYWNMATPVITLVLGYILGNK